MAELARYKGGMIYIQGFAGELHPLTGRDFDKRALMAAELPFGVGILPDGGEILFDGDRRPRLVRNADRSDARICELDMPRTWTRERLLFIEGDRTCPYRLDRAVGLSVSARRNAFRGLARCELAISLFLAGRPLDRVCRDDPRGGDAQAEPEGDRHRPAVRHSHTPLKARA